MKSSAPFTGRGLYAITNGPRADLLDAAAQVLAGGARVIQYRDETIDSERRLAEATSLRQLCHTYGVSLIVDADVVLAKTVAADGVHLGPENTDLASVRDYLGDAAIIGVSCLASLDRAKAAASAGASYVSFGAFFKSPTKPMAGHAPIDLLRQTDALGIPRVAIGGITPDNGQLLIQAGAEFLAAVSAVFGAADARQAAQSFTTLYLSNHGKTA